MKRIKHYEQYNALYEAIVAASHEYDKEEGLPDTNTYGMLENDSKTCIAFRVRRALEKAGYEIVKS